MNNLLKRFWNYKPFWDGYCKTVEVFWVSSMILLILLFLIEYLTN